MLLLSQFLSVIILAPGAYADSSLCDSGTWISSELRAKWCPGDVAPKRAKPVAVLPRPKPNPLPDVEPTAEEESAEQLGLEEKEAGGTQAVPGPDPETVTESSGLDHDGSGISPAEASATKISSPPHLCRAKAVELIRSHGLSVRSSFEKMLRNKDATNTFFTYVDCSDLGFSLSTAFHEGMHGLNGFDKNPDCFPLLDGKSVSCPYDDLDRRLIEPRTIARDYPFDRNDLNVKTYLLGVEPDNGKPVGGSNGGTDFNRLLDELNAWTHDAALNTDLRAKGIAQASDLDNSRLGTMQLMTFIMAYAHYAKRKNPGTWKMLTEPKTRKTVSLLWHQAEAVVQRTCGAGQKSVHRASLNFLCEAKYQEGIEGITSQRVRCPANCR